MHVCVGELRFLGPLHQEARMVIFRGRTVKKKKKKRKHKMPRVFFVLNSESEIAFKGCEME